MMKKISLTLVATLLVCASAFAQQFPSYYPKEGFQRVGTLDAVQPERRVVIINDVPYSLSNNAIVHSPSSFSVPMSRLTVGATIGYKMTASGRLVTEIWLLPNNYQDRSRR